MDAPDRFEELLHAARNGSKEALGELLDSYRPYLLLVANQDLDSQVRAKVAASDLVQETLLTAQQRLSAFHGSDSSELLAWLREILVNDLLETHRKYRGTAKRRVDREVPLGTDSQSAPRQLADVQKTPGTQTAAKEEAEVLARAIAKLPESDREVLRLRNWERLSFEEIGKRLNRTADAVRKQWSRAVVRLQQELKPHEQSVEL